MRRGNLGYIAMMHLSVLAVLTALRMALLSVRHGMVDAGCSAGQELWALVLGVWFDNSLCAYVLALPLLALLMAYMLRRDIPQRALAIYYGVACMPIILAAVSDIPYFGYFFKHIDASILDWQEDADYALAMIFTEARFCVYAALALALCGLWMWVALRSVRDTGCKERRAALATYGTAKHCGLGLLRFLLPVLFCVCSIRGRVVYDERPIRLTDAVFCSSAFLNQVPVPPALNFLRSCMDRSVNEGYNLGLIDADEALALIRSDLGIDGESDVSPLFRVCGSDSTMGSKNVVLVFMESMSYDYLNQGLTPVLDSLCRHSIVFDNFYSCSTHTNQGAFATLYGLPSVLDRHAFRTVPVEHYSGLPTMLQARGYSTLFFIPHNKAFDSMYTFLPENGFDEVYGDEILPPNPEKRARYVADDVLYSHTLRMVDSVAATGRPFMAVYMSNANHPPFLPPGYFKSSEQDVERRTVAYADWSIGRLLNAVRQRSWYANTVFVLVGDHGRLIDGHAQDGCLPGCLNHVPLIIAGEGIEPQTCQAMGTQADVWPTVAGVLGGRQCITGIGRDLLHDRSEYACYSSDNTLAIRSHERLYCYQPATRQEYCYHRGRQVQCDSAFVAMRRHLFAHYATTQYVIQHHLTILPSE